MTITIPPGYRIIEVGMSRVKSPFAPFRYIRIQKNDRDMKTNQDFKDDGSEHFKELSAGFCTFLKREVEK